MNRLLSIKSQSKHPLLFLTRYASKDASSSNTTTTPVDIKKKDSEILAEKKKEYIQVVEPCEMPRVYRRYAEAMASQNKMRSFEHMRQKKRSNASLLWWILVVVCIYFYTMHSIKQETFLEQIDNEMAVEWGTETDEQRRQRLAEDVKKSRGLYAYYLYKWGLLEA